MKQRLPDALIHPHAVGARPMEHRRRGAPSRRFRGFARSSSFVFLPSCSDVKYNTKPKPHEATPDQVTTESTSAIRCRVRNSGQWQDGSSLCAALNVFPESLRMEMIKNVVKRDARSLSFAYIPTSASQRQCAAACGPPPPKWLAARVARGIKG